MPDCQTCGKLATLRCPTCLKKGLPDTHFCSQDCFKSSWNLHKLVHSLTPVAESPHDPFPNYRYTGNLRPVYPLSNKRPVPSPIRKPDYALDANGYPHSEMEIRGSTKIKVLTEDEIEKMRVVGRVFAQLIIVW